MEQTPQNTFDYDSCRRVWQRVSPELDPYPAGEGSAGCPAAPAPDLKRLQELIEGELGDRRFLRCHQSFLVNMDEILSVDQAFHLSSGDAVPIRQRELKRIRARYLDYLAAKERARSVVERLPSVKPE